MVNAISDMADGVTDGVTDHVVIVITSARELVNDVLLTTLVTLA